MNREYKKFQRPQDRNHKSKWYEQDGVERIHKTWSRTRKLHHSVGLTYNRPWLSELRRNNAINTKPREFHETVMWEWRRNKKCWLRDYSGREASEEYAGMVQTSSSLPAGSSPSDS